MKKNYFSPRQFLGLGIEQDGFRGQQKHQELKWVKRPRLTFVGQKNDWSD